MIFTKWFTGSGPRQILGMLLALAVLGTAADVLASTLTLPIEPQVWGSGATSEGEDVVSIGEVWQQGFHDGFLDGREMHGYRLMKRLAQHHYNVELALAYTDGYELGYKLGKW